MGWENPERLIVVCHGFDPFLHSQKKKKNEAKRTDKYQRHRSGEAANCLIMALSGLWAAKREG